MHRFTATNVPFKVKAVWDHDKKGHFKTTYHSNLLPFSCPPDFGGIDNPSPEDLFLVSIGTCTLTTILHICDSLRTLPEALAITVGAEINKDKNGIYHFSEITVEIDAYGEEFLLQRACELAPKYCLVVKSIKPSVFYVITVNGTKI
ncbi:MAG: OsmC family protein [Candidatus Thorarchaeota archaeon]